MSELERVRESDGERVLGFTTAEAKRRHSAGDGNVVPDTLSRSIWAILGANVFTLFNGIVFAGFGVLLALGRWQDALFGLPALFNTLIGVWQEARAKRTLDMLAVLNAPTARVLRDGAPVELPPHYVVLGDVLVLQVGDQVAADAVVIERLGGERSWIDADESLLTGESNAIRKGPGDEVFSGSSVQRGFAYAEVIRVGTSSYASRITAEAKRFQLVRSELRESLDRLLRWISWALIPVATIVAMGQIRAFGGWDVVILNGAWREAIVGAIAAVIAMVPLGLVLVTSIAFAVSGVTLARNHVLIQELPAVEGLARVDTVCLDKTGTITTGEMRLDGVHELSPIRGLELVLGHVGSAPDANMTARAFVERFDGGALAGAVDVPFDSARKWSATVITTDDGSVEPGTWVLGAPDVVLEGRSDADAAAALERGGRLATAGLRTLLVSHAPLAAGIPDVEEPELPFGVHPVALVTVRERVRVDAGPAVAYFAAEGVDVLIISGDDPRTVAAVAAEVGIPVDGGFDARRLPEELGALAEVMDRERVFGRVTPSQKVAMVQALQSHGHVVAMIGDGVNDVLAVKEADLGIAMDVAAQSTKAVARIILLDGRFSRLPGVVAEGRRVIANIERVSKLFLTKTTYALAVGVIFGLAAWAFPFLPRQLSITDGLTIGIPAFFLALMANPARYREGFLKRSLLFSVPAGLIVTGGLLAVKTAAESVGDFSVVEVQSASTLTLAGIALWVLAVMARPLLWFRVLVVVAMYAGLGILWSIGWVRDFFQVTFLPEPLAWTVLIVVLVGMLLVEVLRVCHAAVTGDHRREASSRLRASSRPAASSPTRWHVRQRSRRVAGRRGRPARQRR